MKVQGRDPDLSAKNTHILFYAFPNFSNFIDFFYHACIIIFRREKKFQQKLLTFILEGYLYFTNWKIQNVLKLKNMYQTYVLDLIDAHTQVCGAPAQNSVLAVYSQLVHGQVQDGVIIYKLYVIMYLYLSCNRHSTE